METLTKEAADRDTRGFDYSDELPDGDDIASSVWSSDIGLTLETPTFDGPTQQTSIWWSSGTPGGQYIVRNAIVSAAGRRLERAFRVVVTDDA